MDGLLARVDREFLAAVAGPVPKSKQARQAEILSQTAAILPALMARFEINTLYRITHFTSQVGHESDGFCTTEEYATGIAYEGRKDLGNIKPGDGARFHGRGLIQNTGRTNARNFTLWIRAEFPDAPDFEAHPELMEEFPWAVWVAIWYWDTRRLNVIADRNDLVQVTKVVNGGRNGLDDRAHKLAIAQRWLAAKAVITPIAADVIAKRQNNFPVLYNGIKGREDDVEQLQRALAQAGYYHLAIDCEFGAGTESAVKAFQSAQRLTVDGIAGAKTFSQLSDVLGARP